MNSVRRHNWESHPKHLKCMGTIIDNQWLGEIRSFLGSDLKVHVLQASRRFAPKLRWACWFSTQDTSDWTLLLVSMAHRLQVVFDKKINNIIPINTPPRYKKLRHLYNSNTTAHVSVSYSKSKLYARSYGGLIQMDILIGGAWKMLSETGYNKPASAQFDFFCILKKSEQGTSPWRSFNDRHFFLSPKSLSASVSKCGSIFEVWMPSSSNSPQRDNYLRSCIRLPLSWKSPYLTASW